ncbi:NimC/NimA family protein [Enterocloster clostridioformis]|uniref:NimC/NimA family protein n=1 Tax=Enterocloster clostridioformis TaxID=1531 RepID=UPI0026758CB8|nr:NimC/NimA family protein [Enterocloster clostridioformis]
MEVGDDLYLSTNDFNEVHKQLRKNGHIQIIAKKPEDREWIRITGIASECNDPAMRRKMYEETPILKTHYESSESEHFLMFKVTVENVNFK